MNISAQELAQRLSGTLAGDNCTVSRLVSPDAISPNAVVVIPDDKTLIKLEDLEPTLLIIAEKSTQATKHPHIKVRDTRLALAQLSQLFDDRPLIAESIHPSAIVHPTAKLAEHVHLAENVTVRANAVIGKGSRIGAGCVISDNVQLGEGCLLHPNVTLYANVTLGQRVILHSGCVIGSDGFGYAPNQRGAMKIHHLGSVKLGNDVEIGANTCIDRGTLSDTVIGDRTKIDNLCQIGHNVQMGTDCVMAGRAGIAGSVTIGNRVTIGGSVLMADHVMIGDDVTLAGGTGVSKNIPAGETWGGVPAVPVKKWLRSLYLQGQLETIWQVVKEVKGKM